MGQRKKLILIAAVLAIALGITARVVLPARAADSAARQAAEQYVDLIATGDADDLEQLLAMTATDNPGALRAAGQMLVAAEQRIEVLSVGDPSDSTRSADTGPTPYQSQFEDFVEVDVRYRLDGVDQRATLVLARELGTKGSDLGDWRVVTPMMGSIAWDGVAFEGAGPDLYVSAARQVRRPPTFGNSDENEQPLYPAVYATQARLDPYYATAQASVTVAAGEPTPPPKLRLEPTKRMQREIRREVLSRFDLCGSRDTRDVALCPVADIAQQSGVDIYEAEDWWLGLRRTPIITVDADGVRLSGGVFRFRSPQGIRQVRFGGSVGAYLDAVKLKPYVPPIFEITEGL